MTITNLSRVKKVDSSFLKAPKNIKRCVWLQYCPPTNTAITTQSQLAWDSSPCIDLEKKLFKWFKHTYEMVDTIVIGSCELYHFNGDMGRTSFRSKQNRPERWYCYDKNLNSSKNNSLIPWSSVHFHSLEKQKWKNTEEVLHTSCYFMTQPLDYLQFYPHSTPECTTYDV